MRVWTIAGVLIVATGPLGCVEDCEECQLAIDHMASKIESNGCQPSLMENAVNRIRRECDDGFADWYIGRLVDECQAGYAAAAVCEQHPLFGFEFEVINQLGENVTFTFGVEDGDKELIEDVPAGGRAARATRFISSGSTFVFEVINDNGDLLTTGEATAVLRSNPADWEPWLPRTVTLVPGMMPEDPPILMFANWE